MTEMLKELGLKLEGHHHLGTDHTPLFSSSNTSYCTQDYTIAETSPALL